MTDHSNGTFFCRIDAFVQKSTHSSVNGLLIQRDEFGVVERDVHAVASCCCC